MTIYMPDGMVEINGKAFKKEHLRSFLNQKDKAKAAENALIIMAAIIKHQLTRTDILGAEGLAEQFVRGSVFKLMPEVLALGSPLALWEATDVVSAIFHGMTCTEVLLLALTEPRM